MKIKINADQLLDILNKSVSFCDKKAVFPSLKNFMVEADNGELKISATDLEIGITTSIPAEITSSGGFTVNGKKLRDLVKEIPNDTVDFTAAQDLQVDFGKNSTTLKTLDINEFPKLPAFTGRYNKVSCKALLAKIRTIAFAMSHDETRYHLNGMYFKPVDGDVEIVATDGHRMAKNRLGFNPDIFPEKGIILPRIGISELVKVLNENTEVDLGCTEKHLFARAGNNTMSMRLIDGEYPNYNNFFPKNNNIEIKIDRQEFFSAIRRTSILANQDSKGIKIEFLKGQATITASSEIGNARETIPIFYTGEIIVTAFNSTYVLDALNTFDDEVFSMMFKDGVTPAIIAYDSDKTAASLIMPMRL